MRYELFAGVRNAPDHGTFIEYKDYAEAVAELATVRAQLAGVRERVEKLDRYDPIVDCNEPYMEHTERGDYFACADVLAALGGDA